MPKDVHGNVTKVPCHALVVVVQKNHCIPLGSTVHLPLIPVHGNVNPASQNERGDAVDQNLPMHDGPFTPPANGDVRKDYVRLVINVSMMW